MKNGTDLLFEVDTPLKFTVSITKKYWDYITTIKHPHIKGKESDVKNTLEDPDFIRQSKMDGNVYLFYRKVEYHSKNYHMCVVINKNEGFIITSYITDRIKEGIQIWIK